MEGRERTVAGVAVAGDRFEAGDVSLPYYRVRDLEELVDRDALLNEQTVPEPPYWAHLWVGARAVARAIAVGPPLAGRSVLDLGCGIGLPGLVAMARGARVTFLDLAPEGLEVVRASAALAGLGEPELVRADFTADRLGRRFDVILCAEVVYEPLVYAPLAAFLDEHLAAHGELVVTDAFRSDARRFFDALESRGFVGERARAREVEDGRPQGLFLWRFRRSGPGGTAFP